MCYCFRAPIKTFFFDTCQMTVKSCVLHLFPVPQTGRSHIVKHLISLVFSVRTVNYGPSSFPSIYGPRASRLGHKSMEKNSVRNLQYRPKTRLIRGMYRPPIRLITGYIDAFLEPLAPMSSLFALYELLIGSNNFGTK